MANPNLAVNKLKQPIGYNLESLSLIAPGFTGILDLMPYMVELNYFEDIFNNTISGNVVVTDAVGILNFASISGTEYIKIKFSKSADLPASLERTFRVFAISDRRFDLANNNEVYKIEFCSEEYILSEQYRISKAYKGWKISNIVADICNTYLKIGSEKNVNIDDTSGVYDFVLPNKKPIETINWLTNYAIPSKYPNGADILFFENRTGYYFTSLQHMFQTDPVLGFAYNPKNIKSDVFEKMSNILSFEVVKYVDTLHAMNKGTFANRLISIDPLRRKKTVIDFNYNNYFKNSITTNGSPVTNNFKNRLGKSLFDAPSKDMEAGVLRMAISNANQQNGGTFTKNKPGTVSADYQIERSLPNRVAQLSLSTHTTLKLTVPGNPSLVVGTCITVNISSVDQLNSKQSRPLDPYLSGKYLVTAVRHIISPASYICVVEISKDSGLMNYSGVNNNDPGWNKLVSGNQK